MQELGITEDQTVQKRCDCLRTIQHPHNPEAIQTCITKLKNGDYLTAIDSARAILKLDLSPEQRGAIIQLNNGKLPSLALLNATVAAYPSEITEEIARKIREICAFLNISNSDLYSDPLLILLSNTLASDEFHSQRPATNLTLEEFKEACQETNPLRFACARAKLFAKMRVAGRTAVHGERSDFERQKDQLTLYLKEAQKQAESTTDQKRRELLIEWITSLDLFIKDITHSSIKKIPEGTEAELALLHAPENLLLGLPDLSRLVSIPKTSIRASLFE